MWTVCLTNIYSDHEAEVGMYTADNSIVLMLVCTLVSFLKIVPLVSPLHYFPNCTLKPIKLTTEIQMLEFSVQVFFEWYNACQPYSLVQGVDNSNVESPPFRLNLTLFTFDSQSRPSCLLIVSLFPTSHCILVCPFFSAHLPFIP